MGTPTPGQTPTRLLGQLAEGWRDYRYCCRRFDEMHRPWLYGGPLRWAHSRRGGWHLLGTTLPANDRSER